MTNVWLDVWTTNTGSLSRTFNLIAAGIVQSCSTTIMDLVFVIDSSGSIRDHKPDDGSDNWNHILQFIVDLVDGLSVGEDKTRVGAVKFSNTGESVFYLNTHYDVASLKQEILDMIYVGGNTNTSGGLREMVTNQFISSAGDRRDVQNVAIVITDGVSTYDKLRTVPDAVEARASGIKIFSVGITESIDENELRLMSSIPQEKGKNYFTSTSFQALNLIKDSILKVTCSVTLSGKKIYF